MTAPLYPRYVFSTLMLALSAFLQACGGGSGGEADLGASADTTDNPGGVAVYSGSESAYLGTISGLGSIVVNGVRFETTSAQVLDSDDLYGSTEHLNPMGMGMTVALQGSADETQWLGRASRIRLIGGVRGTVSANAAQQMTVGGQAIALNDQTIVVDVNGSATTVQTNDFVNVFGLMQADNTFLATRVQKASAANFQMDAAWRGQSSLAVGSPSGLGTDWAFSLSTGGTTPYRVTCPAASCSVEPSGADLSGLHAVRVLAADDTQRTGSNIVASRVQVLDAARVLSWAGSTVSVTKIKGVASTDGTQWMIGGVPVVHDSTPWQAGLFYEVKGTLTNGRMSVTRWEQEGQESYRQTSSGSSSYYRHELYGAVSNLQGTRMTVQGMEVEMSQAYFERGSLATLANGAYVEVKGVLNAGVLTASKIEVKSNSTYGVGTRFEVYGTVSNWTSSGFTLSSGGTIYNAILTHQTSVDVEHGLPGNGKFVEAKGYMQGADFVVVKLEVKSLGDHLD